MINLLVAIRLWGTQWQSKRIVLKCDNLAVVNVLNTGRSQDSLLCTIARNILMSCAHLDIEVNFVHIAGKVNVVADTLSRWTGSIEQLNKLHCVISHPIWCHVDHKLLQLDYNI